MIIIRLIIRLFPWLLLIGLSIFFIFTRNRWKYSNNEQSETTTVVHSTVVESIESLGRLELVKYNFKEVTEVNIANPKFLRIFDVPPSKAVLITSGEAVGCIDLRKIKLEDITLQGDAVYVSLPQPELCYYKLDLTNSKIYSIDKVVYYREEKDLVEAAYKNAEVQIRKAAISTGILEETTQNAEKILRPMLEEISGRKVFFRTEMSTTIEDLK